MPLLQRALVGALSGLILLIGAVVSQAATDTGVYVEFRESDQPGARVVDRWRLYGASHALVIGVDNYTNGWPRLSNAVKDAELVAGELRNQGFDVELLTDLTGAQLREALRRFFAFKGKDPQARLFVWFAGHGHTKNGEGYLVPADAPLPGSPEFNYTALHMGDVGSMVRIAESKHVLAVFDSCFAGTVFSSQRSRPPAAITSAVKRPVRQFLTSGDAEQKVSDDGTFRTLFLRALLGEETADANRDGYLTGTELSFYLENRVINLTQGVQTPRGGKLRDPKFDQGDFVFVLPKLGAQVAALPRVAKPAKSSEEAAYELAFWDAIKDSKAAGDYQAYLEAFPAGRFAPLAKARINSLSGRDVVAPVATPAAETQKARPPPKPKPGSELIAKLQADADAWQAVRGSDDPAALEGFAQDNPESDYASKARRRAAILRRQAVDAQTASLPPSSVEFDEQQRKVEDYIARNERRFKKQLERYDDKHFLSGGALVLMGRKTKIWTIEVQAAKLSSALVRLHYETGNSSGTAFADEVFELRWRGAELEIASHGNAARAPFGVRPERR